MKAYKLALPLLAATTLVCTSVGVANAQEDPADCGAATIALNQADQAHRDAVDADQKLADAEDADQALKDAKQRLKNAEKQRDVASADVTAKKAELDRVTAEATAGNPDTPEDERVVTPEEQAKIDVAQTALDVAKKTLKNREDTVEDRQDELDQAEKDAKSRTAKLREKANETDAGELQKALDDAKADFDRLCGGVTTTPTPEPAPSVDLDCGDFPLADGRTAQQVLDSTPGEDPNGIDADGDRNACEPGQDTADNGSDLGDNEADVSGDVVTPSGGIATGVGPRDS